MTRNLGTQALLSPYPPSFDGNPWSYGFALFSLTLICAMCAAMLLHFLFEFRARLAARAKAGEDDHLPFICASPLTIHRAIVMGFLMTILIGAFPDVLILYSWGEAGPEVIDALFLIDRICDGMTSIPLLFSFLLSAWSAQVIPQQLITTRDIGIRAPQLRTVVGQFKIVGMVSIIATGVTIAKAAAAT